MLTLQGEPAQPRQEEVEYSTVVSARAGGGEGVVGSPGLCEMHTTPHATWRQQTGREERGWLGDIVPLQHRATQNVGQV